MIRMDTPSHTDAPWSHSQLYTVRVWYELMEADDWEVRMQAIHILSGETRYFREWSRLAAYLVSKLDAIGEDNPAAAC